MRQTGLLTVACLLVASVSSAQDDRQRIVQRWDAMRAAAVEQLKKQAGTASADDRLPAERARDAATRQTSVSAAVDAVEPDDSSTAATVRRLAGAIKTNPEGTEAGVVIAPFLLADAPYLRGLEVTLAALKADVTRLGGSYTWNASPTLEQVWKGPAPCPVSEERLDQLDEPRDFYVSVCTALVPLLAASDETSSNAVMARNARKACGFDEPPGAPVMSMSEAIATLKHVIPIAQRPQGSEPPGYNLQTAGLATALGLQGALDAVADWNFPTATSCYTNNDVRQHIQRLFWNAPSKKFAVGVNWDFFPRKYGFSPDGSRLPEGDLKAFEVRADFSRARQGTEVGFGVGLGNARTELTDDLGKTLGLSFSASRALTLLKSSPLRTREGELNLYEGALPPRFVLGVTTSAEIAIDKPASQDTDFNSFKFQPYLDFLITETLSFRLGIPVRAEIVERKAKDAVEETPTTPAVPAVTAQRSLQWTVPVALVAVLKM